MGPGWTVSTRSQNTVGTDVTQRSWRAVDNGSFRGTPPTPTGEGPSPPPPPLFLQLDLGGERDRGKDGIRGGRGREGGTKTTRQDLNVREGLVVRDRELFGRPETGTTRGTVWVRETITTKANAVAGPRVRPWRAGPTNR